MKTTKLKLPAIHEGVVGSDPFFPATNAQHTPGPWNINSEARDIQIVAGRQLIATCSRLYKEDVEAAEANARLIASAPELLAALRDAEAGLEVARKALATAEACAQRDAGFAVG